MNTDLEDEIKGYNKMATEYFELKEEIEKIIKVKNRSYKLQFGLNEKNNSI